MDSRRGLGGLAVGCPISSGERYRGRRPKRKIAANAINKATANMPKILPDCLAMLFLQVAPKKVQDPDFRIGLVNLLWDVSLRQMSPYCAFVLLRNQSSYDHK